MKLKTKLAAPVAVVAFVASPAGAAPPRYAMQTLESPTVTGTQPGAVARILAFDGEGNGYGFSLTGATSPGLAAVRWQGEGGSMSFLPTPAGSFSSHAAAVSPTGEIVGWSANSADRAGLLWRGGAAHSLGNLLPLGINSSGTIAGVVRNPVDGRRHAPAVWQNGRVTLLPMDRPDASGWVAGVSGSGEVAGSWYSGAGEHRAVRWVDGRAQVLPLPAGAGRSEAIDINEAGWIVGAAYQNDAATRAAVLWRGGEVVNLGVLDPSTPDAWAQSINSRGQVVGTAETSTGRTIFLWEGGEMHDLRDLLGLGAADFNAAHLVIGDTGHIAGVQLLPDGTSRGFVLAPVPGPAGCLALAGAALFGLRRRR